MTPFCCFYHGPLSQMPRIAHWDVKPSNILLTLSSHVQLIDFGISWKEGLSVYFQGYALVFDSTHHFYGSRLTSTTLILQADSSTVVCAHLHSFVLVGTSLCPFVLTGTCSRSDTSTGTAGKPSTGAGTARTGLRSPYPQSNPYPQRGTNWFSECGGPGLWLHRLNLCFLQK